MKFINLLPHVKKAICAPLTVNNISIVKGSEVRDHSYDINI